MATVYFKRFRMATELQSAGRSESRLPSGFSVLPWSTGLIRDHARAKFESFRDEVDASVFPCLGRKESCLQLMRDLSARADFVPAATWLAVFQGPNDRKAVPVGTIQGLRTDASHGAIQNIGIVPAFRSLGLGTILIRRALEGFASVGCRTATLEVTVQNFGAIRLYQRLGFQRTETVFKVGELTFA